MNLYLFYIYSSLLNVLSMAGFGLFVYLKNKKKLTNKTFGLLCVSTAIWSLGLFFCHLCKDGTTALYCNRFLVHAVAIFIPTFYFRFILAFLEKLKEKRRALLFTYASSLFLFLFSFTPFLVKEMKPDATYRFWPVPGPAYPLFLLHFLGIVAYVCYLLLKLYTQASGFRRNQIKYILLATLVGFGGGSTNYFLFYNIPIHPFGHPLVALYPLVLCYAIVKYRLMDINIVVNKAIVFTVLVGLLLTLHTALTTLLKPVVGTFTALAISVIAVATIALILCTSRNGIAKLFNSLVYHGKYDYQQVLKEATKALITKVELNELLEHIVKLVAENIGVRRVSLFLQDEPSGDYHIAASYGIDNESKKRFILRADSDTISWLRENRSSFVREEIERALSDEKFRNVYNGLFKIRAEVVTPLFYQGKLIGAINLDYKNSNQMYTQQDIDILESVAAEAAIAIENARMYKEMITEPRTRLYNYNYFQKRMGEELERANRGMRPLALLLIEIKHFGFYSQQKIDSILSAISQKIKNNIRSVDIPCYVQEKRLAVIFPDSSRQEKLDRVSRFNSFANGIASAEQRLKINVEDKSNEEFNIDIGAVTISGQDRNLTKQDLIEKAKSALEIAGQAKDRIWIISEPITDDTPEKKEEAKEEPDEILEADGIQVNISRRLALAGNRPLKLTKKEFDLLCYFIKKKKRVLSRSTLMDNVWGYNFYGNSHTVDVHVAQLRRKLGRYAKKIKTVDGVGYRFTD